MQRWWVEQSGSLLKINSSIMQRAYYEQYALLHGILTLIFYVYYNLGSRINRT